MIDSLISSTVGWLEEKIIGMFDIISGIFGDVFGTDMTNFNYIFGLDSIVSIMQALSFTIMFLIVIFQLLRGIAGPMAQAQDEPWKLLVRMVIAIILIFTFIPISNLILDIASWPYQAIMELREDLTIDGMGEALRAATMPGDDSSSSPLYSGTVDAGSTILLDILGLVFFFALLFEYVKFLLNMAERYASVGLLLYTSPLAASMMPSKTTSNVFASWCRLLGTQIFLLIMNALFLAMVTYGFSGLSEASGKGVSNCVYILCLVGFLRVATKFDTYLGMVGLNAAPANMGMDLMMGMRGLGTAAHRIGNVASGVNRAGHAVAGGIEGARNPGGPGVNDTYGMKSTTTETRASDGTKDFSSNSNTNSVTESKTGDTTKEQAQSIAGKNAAGKQGGTGTGGANGQNKQGSSEENNLKVDGTKADGKGAETESTGSNGEASEDTKGAEPETDHVGSEDTPAPEGTDEKGDETPEGTENTESNVPENDNVSGGEAPDPEENETKVNGEADDGNGEIYNEKSSDSENTSDVTGTSESKENVKSDVLKTGNASDYHGETTETTSDGTKETNSHKEGTSTQNSNVRQKSDHVTDKSGTSTINGTDKSHESGSVKNTRVTTRERTDAEGNSLGAPTGFDRVKSAASGARYGWHNKETKGQHYRRQNEFKDPGPSRIEETTEGTYTNDEQVNRDAQNTYQSQDRETSDMGYSEYRSSHEMSDIKETSRNHYKSKQTYRDRRTKKDGDK